MTSTLKEDKNGKNEMNKQMLYKTKWKEHLPNLSHKRRVNYDLINFLKNHNLEFMLIINNTIAIDLATLNFSLIRKIDNKIDKLPWKC